MDTTLRALNRFGLGARIGERDGLRRAVQDPREWLRTQVRSASPEIDEVASLDEIEDALRGLREAQRSRDQDAVRAAARRGHQIRESEMRAMLNARVTTQTPYVERMVAFWSNHLCVSFMRSPQVAALTGHYERTAIRPHVLGNFVDMVMASAKHPAMLLYLDNAQSVGPGSRAGRQTARRGQARGLNENYARELLELHTLGVDGGYTQADVEQLARVLTGWTVAGFGPGTRPDERLGFAFRGIIHEPGDKTVLGERYREGGVREGERVIRDLCAHPSTARFVASKLVRHFVDDEPPASAVDRIAEVFTETDGDLKAVALALIDLDEAWDPGHTKFRTPQDWLVAVFRTFHADEAPEPMGPLLNQLRHTPWAPGAPKGFGDLEREWADPDALMNRAELARTIAGHVGQGGGLDPRRILEVVDVEADDPLRTMLADTSIPVPERMALAVGGPAFQWR